jgi:hypothetical protein
VWAVLEGKVSMAQERRANEKQNERREGKGNE